MISLHCDLDSTDMKSLYYITLHPIDHLEPADDTTVQNCLINRLEETISKLASHPCYEEYLNIEVNEDGAQVHNVN